MLPPGNQRNPPLLDESLQGVRQRPMLLRTLPCFLAARIVTRGVVYHLVLPGICHLLLSPPGSPRLRQHGVSQTNFFAPKTPPRHFHHRKILCREPRKPLSTDHCRLLNSLSLLRQNGRCLLDTLLEICASWAQ